jgi:hypothetical protein
MAPSRLPTTAPTPSPASFKLVGAVTLFGLSADQFGARHREELVNTLAADLRLTPATISTISVKDVLSVGSRLLAARAIIVTYEIFGVPTADAMRAETRIKVLAFGGPEVASFVNALQARFDTVSIWYDRSGANPLSAQFGAPSRISTTDAPTPAPLIETSRSTIEGVALIAGLAVVLLCICVYSCERRSRQRRNETRVVEQQQISDFSEIFSASKMQKKRHGEKEGVESEFDAVHSDPLGLGSLESGLRDLRGFQEMNEGSILHDLQGLQEADGHGIDLSVGFSAAESPT